MKWTEVSAKLIVRCTDVRFLWTWRVFYSFVKHVHRVYFTSFFFFVPVIASVHFGPLFSPQPLSSDVLSSGTIFLSLLLLFPATRLCVIFHLLSIAWCLLLLFICSFSALFYYTCFELNKSFIFKRMKRAADSHFFGNHNATHCK